MILIPNHLETLYVFCLMCDVGSCIPGAGVVAAAPNNAVLALEMQAALTWSEEKLTTLRRTCLLRKEFKPVPELLAQLRSHYLSDVYEPKAAVARAFLAKSEKAKVATKRLEDSGPQIVANSNVDKQIETHRLRNKMARLKDAERETGASGANDKAPQVKPLDGAQVGRLL